eukprot:5779347-Prymnesium_polylepis.1
MPIPDRMHRCVFENAVSSEVIVRLSAYPKMRAVLDKLPPKVLSLASGRPTEAVELATGELDSRVERVVGRIQKATFTGKGDKESVPALFQSYVERIAGVLQKTLAFVSDDDSAPVTSALPSA